MRESEIVFLSFLISFDFLDISEERGVTDGSVVVISFLIVPGTNGRKGQEREENILAARMYAKASRAVTIAQRKPCALVSAAPNM